MNDEQITAFRAAERIRMSSMREAARKEAFVQGWLRGTFGDLSLVADHLLLESLADAGAAYLAWASKRGPA